MSKKRDQIDGEMREWIARQKVFFVGTAPLSSAGHVNVSPKGGEAFKVLGPLEAVYHDYTGSGAETAAHLRENGRIVILFCSFEGSPKIVRLHGRGIVIAREHPRYREMAAHFPPNAGTRSYVHISVTRVSDSCGYSVPFFDFRGPRETLNRWAEKQGCEKLTEYRTSKNGVSIDGLPAFDAAC